jgi:hypothetical protein
VPARFVRDPLLGNYFVHSQDTLRADIREK